MDGSWDEGFFRVAASRSRSREQALKELLDGLGAAPAVLVLFFASPVHDLAELARALGRAYPDALVAGCTSSGEIGPLGMTEEGIAALALGPPARVAAVLVDDLSRFHFEDGSGIVAELAHRLGRRPEALSGGEHVLLTLTDGLSGLEEIVVASLAVNARGLPLAGGSAGDDLRFEATRVVLGDRESTNGAVLLLLEPNAPFHVFHVHHFRPTETRVVVTDADPEHRLVRELDGWPAVEVMARILGLGSEEVQNDPVRSFSKRPVTLAYQVGGTHYLRSVMRAQGQALLMGGAVEEGTVLRVMEGGDLVLATQEGVAQALAALPTPATGLVLFNCGGRFIEAQSTGVLPELFEVMSPVPAVGFVTYGEQFGALQVNHTLTGIALGRPRRA